MNKTILFSCVGQTDPIRNNYDGAMLHICRYYQPDEVHLYLSKEMAERDRKDNRYDASIQLLAKKMGKKIDVVKYRKEIENPADFSVFGSEFYTILSKINNEAPEQKILLNVSSGTPQMKAGLCLCAVTMDITCKPIQVLTPVKKGNKSKPVGEEYDTIQEFENNLDNLEGECENRTLEPDILSFRRAMIANQLKILVNKYDYTGALTLIKQSKLEVSSIFIRLIEHMAYRMLLKQGDALKKVSTYQGQSLCVVKDVKCSELVEYLLGMKHKVVTNNITDFLLRLSPFTVALQLAFLKEQCQLNISEYMNEYKEISREILKQKNPNLLGHIESGLLWGELRNGYPSIKVLNLCIDWQMLNHSPTIQQQRAQQLFQKIEKIIPERNSVAHQLVIQTHQCITKHNTTAPQIIKECAQVIRDTYKKRCPENSFKQYEIINQFIYNEIEAIL